MTVLRVTLGLPPGHLAINKRNKIAHTKDGPRIVKAKRYAKGQADAYLDVRQAAILAGWRIPRAACALVRTHWPTDEGDVDACCKAVLDALQAGRVVENDRHLAPVVLDHVHDDPDPRIEIVVATTLAELLPLLGWELPISA